MRSLRDLGSRLLLAGAIGAAGIGAILLLSGNDDANGGSKGGAWRALESSPLSRTEVGAARIGRFVYVLGGFQSPDGPTTDQVARYDTISDSWSLIGPLPAKVNHPAVATHGGRVYVYGGYTDVGAETDALQRFNPATGVWTSLKGSGTARGAATLAAVGDSLYAIGGAHDGGSPLSLVQIYDLQTGTWRTGPPMKVAREHLASAALGDRILVLGGRVPGGNLDIVEVLNTRTRRWSMLPSMRTARSGFQAAAVNDTVVVIGGETIGIEPAHTIAPVELYQAKRKRWRALPEMPTPRHGLGVVSSGRRVLAIEGGPQPALAFSNVLEQLTIPKRLLGR